MKSRGNVSPIVRQSKQGLSLLLGFGLGELLVERALRTRLMSALLRNALKLANFRFGKGLRLDQLILLVL